MSVGEVTRGRARVLLVSDDDAFSADLKPCLPGVDVLSLTESSVWLANRAGLDVTRGINAVLVDHQVSGRLQMGLYETLRPSDGPAQVPVIFTRSKLTAASAGFSHELDVYQPEEASAIDTAQLVSHVLGLDPMPARQPDRKSAKAPKPSARAARTAPRPVMKPARQDASPEPSVAAAAAPARRVGVAVGPGLVQRLALWGIASALIGFTFWPLFGSGPIREAIFGPLRSLSGGSGELANAGLRERTP
ncbi:MAG: hypothetical protein U0893_18530 [Chloroflexota bacterium]